MDDIRAVMDAVGSEKAALLGFSDGGSMSCLFAATFPQKVHALILFGAFAKAFSTPDYPHMPTRDERMGRMQMWAENWGQGFCLKSLAPEMFEDEAMRNLYGRWERLSGTPNSMRKYFDVVIDTDVRPVLGSITVPTLVLHRRDDMQIPFAAGQHLADAIDGARLVDLGNGGHVHWNRDRERFAGEIQEFLTGMRTTRSVSERVLLTVMFTDIVDSTAKLTEIGDGEWRATLDRHDAIAARLVEAHRGRIVKSTGDGVLATFDGPGRAIQCSIALTEQVRALGIEIRAGLHTGEVELRGEDISGVAVNLAARIMAEAGPGEVLSSRIVSDLVAGAALCEFTDRGNFALKGFPGEWPLLGVEA